MKLVFTTTLLFFTFIAFCQSPEIPDDVKLETAQDYKDKEQLVLKSIQWLANTPINQQIDERKKVNTFLIQWLTGSPSVSIELRSEFLPDNCADCMMSFMAGWTKYSLENDYSKDKVACAIAGINSVIALYEKNKESLGRNADIEKMIKRKKKEKLQKYVEGVFSD